MPGTVTLKLWQLSCQFMHHHVSVQSSACQIQKLSNLGQLWQHTMWSGRILIFFHTFLKIKSHKFYRHATLKKIYLYVNKSFSQCLDKKYILKIYDMNIFPFFFFKESSWPWSVCQDIPASNAQYYITVGATTWLVFYKWISDLTKYLIEIL